MKYSIGEESLSPEEKPANENEPSLMPGIKDYEMGTREDTKLPAVAQQLQYNRPFSWYRNNQEMPITPLILEQSAGTHKPFSDLEAPAINKALDTNGCLFADRSG